MENKSEKTCRDSAPLSNHCPLFPQLWPGHSNPTSPTHKMVVEVAYSRWLFMGGFDYKALIGKMLAFWIGGQIEEIMRGGRL